jgi:preprotein translocase SecE subunit
VQTQTPGDVLRQQKEAKADEGNNIFAGASEEIGLIEWPTAGKAMQTTGVVILGIVLSAVFLLVVNEVLSTLSGKIFN